VQSLLPVPLAKVPGGHSEQLVTTPADETGLARTEPSAQGVHDATVGSGKVPGAQYELSEMRSTSVTKVVGRLLTAPMDRMPAPVVGNCTTMVCHSIVKSELRYTSTPL